MNAITVAVMGFASSGALPPSAAHAGATTGGSSPALTTIGSEDRTSTRDASFVAQVSLAVATGATSRQLTRRFGLTWVGSMSSQRKWDAFALAERGLGQAGGAVAARKNRPDNCARSISAATNPSSIVMPRPGFFRRNQPPAPPSRERYVIAKWQFKKRTLSGTGGCTPRVGGRDGFGVTLSRDVKRRSQSLTRCNSVDLCDYGGSMADNSPRGATYTFQDHQEVLFPNGDFDHGAITVSFTPYKEKACHQAFAKYAHSWSTSSLTGFGVGPYSFSLQWSSTAHKWERSSSAGSDWNC